MQQITREALLEAGYREHPDHRVGSCDHLFQKRIDDFNGAMYFVNFREWRHPDGNFAWDAELACETTSGGYVWVTIKEDTIVATESRAGLMWAAAGSVYYDL